MLEVVQLDMMIWEESVDLGEKRAEGRSWGSMMTRGLGAGREDREVATCEFGDKPREDEMGSSNAKERWGKEKTEDRLLALRHWEVGNLDQSLFHGHVRLKAQAEKWG